MRLKILLEVEVVWEGLNLDVNENATGEEICKFLQSDQGQG